MSKPNQSDNQNAQNMLAQEQDLKFESIARRHSTPYASEMRMIMRSGTLESEMEELSPFVGQGSAKEQLQIQEKLKARQVEFDRVEEKLRREEQRRVSTGVTRMRAEVNSTMGLGGMRSYIGAATEELGMSGVGVAQQRSTSELEVQRKQAMIMAAQQRDIAMQNVNVFDASGSLDTNKMGVLNQARSTQRNYLEQVAQAESALRAQKKLGIDTESRYYGAQRQSASVERDLMKAGIAKEIESGNAPSLNDARKEELRLLEQFSKQMKEVNEATEKTGPAFEQLLGKVEQTSKDLDKTQEVIRQRSSGGGGDSNTMKLGRNLYAASNIISQLGNTYREITVGQTNAITGNRITAASMTNSLYERRNAALAGDMTQLGLLSGDAFQRAAGEGKINERNTNVANVATTAAGGLGVIAGGLMTAGAIAGGTGIGMPVGVALAGAGALAYGLSDLTRGGGISGTAENLAEQQRQIQLQEEMSRITGAQRQKLYNYSMSSRTAALTAGGAQGQSYFDQYAGPGGDAMLAKMANMRIGADQFAELSAQGFQQGGSTFNPNSIFTAREMESRGYGTMSQNVGRISQLAAAGSQNPQASFGSVLEAAFSKSLDSSKALDMMVQNTAALVQVSAGAARGMDTTASSAAIISGLVDSNNPNKEFAIQRATNAADILNQINTGTGVNFADMSGIAAIAAGTGVGQMGAVNLKKLDNQTRAAIGARLDDIDKMDPKERGAAEAQLRSDMTLKYGLGSFLNKDTGDINKQALRKGLDLTSESIFRKGEFIANVDPNLPGYQEFTQGKLTADELMKRFPNTAVKVGESAAALGLTVDEVASGGRAASTAAGAAKAAEVQGKAMGPEPKTAFSDADKLATAAMQNMTKEAMLAAKELGGVAQALSKISEATEKLGGKLNESTSDEFRGAAAKAAADFKIAADTFTGGVSQFGTFLKTYSERANIKLPSSDSKTSKVGMPGE